MSTWYMLLREWRFRAGNALLGGAAVALAVAVWSGSLVILRGHDARTVVGLDLAREQAAKATAELEDGIRRATLKLSFNLVILPEGQDLRAWHNDGEIRGALPEAYVRQLADSGIATIQHLLPIVQRRLLWEEKGRRIILVGTRGEVAQLHSNPKKPLVQPVPPGSIVLGYELHSSLRLNVGDQVELMGREFTVHRCHEARGSQDDITAWIDLGQAQELLGLQGQVHAILALECMCAGFPGADKFRAEVRRILPHTDVIELGSKALARAESRLKLAEEVAAGVQREETARAELRQARERVAGVLVPVAFLAGLLAVAALAAANARARGPELALLRALGWRERQVLTLLLARYALIALPAALVGCALGVGVGAGLAAWLDPVALPNPAPLLTATEWAGAAAAGVAATLLAVWLPALQAAGRDPAPALTAE